METYWVPGVNHLKTYGRWAFAEFRSAHDLEADFKKLIQGFVTTSSLPATV
jgi:type III restriction enzyme